MTAHGLQDWLAPRSHHSGQHNRMGWKVPAVALLLFVWASWASFFPSGSGPGKAGPGLRGGEASGSSGSGSSSSSSSSSRPQEECPFKYPRMTLEEVAAGHKPYLFGGHASGGRACPACERKDLWADLCQFKYSHYYGEGEGRWPTLAACGEKEQRDLLNAWVQRGYELPLSLTPCDLWHYLRGHTLFMLGDSIMQDFFLAMRCFFFEFWDTLSEEPLTQNQTLLEQISWIPDWARPTCALLAGGAGRICFFRIDDGNQFYEKVLPFLLSSRLAAPTDLLIANFGMHGGDIRHMAEQFAAYVKQHRAQLPRVYWQQTSAQHFATESGEWPGGKAPFQCAPLVKQSFFVEGEGLLRLRPTREDQFNHLQGGFPNIASDPPMRAAGIPIIPSFNESVPMWYAHRDNGKGHECTHYCHPSAPQSWILNFYKLLRQLELGSQQ